MPTTIQVEDPTINLLKKLKEKEKARSYDEIIIQLFKKRTKESMAGALARKKKYSTIEILRGMRDERDRY